MQLGLTWPLQRLLRITVPYGETIERGYCWDAHCITLHGRYSLLLVHCESRYTTVLYDLSGAQWNQLEAIALQEIRQSLFDAGIVPEKVNQYLADAGLIFKTRTHGRREAAFLNRAWNDVLALDFLIDQESFRQPALNVAVNNRLCRCAGEAVSDTALAHLERYFMRQ